MSTLWFHPQSHTLTCPISHWACEFLTFPSFHHENVLRGKHWIYDWIQIQKQMSHFPLEYNLHWKASISQKKSACILLSLRQERNHSCSWASMSSLVFIVCEEREATLASDCSCWLDSRKSRKWGLKAHGWLLEPATTFSLMRKATFTALVLPVASRHRGKC